MPPAEIEYNLTLYFYKYQMPPASKQFLVRWDVIPNFFRDDILAIKTGCVSSQNRAGNDLTP